MSKKNMNPKDALASLEADVALAALDRYRRGESDPEGPFSPEELQRLDELTAPASAEQEARRAEALLAAVASPPVQAAEVRAQAPRRSARRRTAYRIGAVLLPFAAAAAFLMLLMPMGSLPDSGRVAVREFTTNPSVLAPKDPLIKRRFPLNECANIRLALSSEVARESGSLRAEAYLISEQGEDVRPWNIPLEPTTRETLSSLRCTSLPDGIAPGRWELVVLIGYPGKLWLSRKAVLSSSRGATEGVRNGLVFVRERIEIIPPGAAP